MLQRLFLGSTNEADDDIVITQQPSIGEQAAEVVKLISAELVAVDQDNKGLMRGLSSFIRAQPIDLENVMDRAIDQIVAKIRMKARQSGANAVVNVRIQSIRGVESGGPRLVRISAVGTAVRFKTPISVNGGAS